MAHRHLVPALILALLTMLPLAIATQADMDNDGFPDEQDLCPSIPGTAEGCPVYHAPLIVPLPDQEVVVGETVQVEVVAADEDNDVLVLYAESMPPGAVFVDHADGTGTFTWTATVPGTYTVIFAANDGIAEYQEVMLITVLPVEDEPTAEEVPADDDVPDEDADEEEEEQIDEEDEQEEDTPELSSEERLLEELKDEFGRLEEDYHSLRRDLREAQEDDDEDDIEQAEEELDEVLEDLEDMEQDAEDLEEDIEDNDDLENQDELLEEVEDLQSDISRLRSRINSLLGRTTDETEDIVSTQDSFTPPAAPAPVTEETTSGTEVELVPFTFPLPVQEQELRTWENYYRPLAWGIAGVVVLLAVVIFLLGLAFSGGKTGTGSTKEER